MNKYANGKIYMIITENSNDIYVGSTTKTLKLRLQEHESNYRTGKYCSSQEIFKQGNYKIVLIKDYPCSSDNELEREEGKFQRDLVCVNKLISGRTRKEWYEDNREAKIAKQKEYNMKNREAITTYKKEYYSKNKEAIINKQKEYNMKNREAICTKQREFYSKNKEAILNKLNEKFSCDCGGKYTRGNKIRHFKSKKHQKFLKVG